METQTIQNVINKRAESKLRKDLDFLSDLYARDDYKYKYLFKGIKINMGTTEKPEVEDIIFVFRNTRRFYKEAFEKNLPKYIEEETVLFLKEIEELKSKVETLEGDVSSLFGAIH